MSEEFEKNLDNEEFLQQLFDDLDMINAEVDDASEIGGAAAGMGIGAAASFGALYGLGTVGLSAVGITTGLAAAGALVGGGMVAGIGVLAAPIAILAVGGYAIAHAAKVKRIRQLQKDVLAKALTKQNEILQRLHKKASLSAKVITELKERNLILKQIINALRKKLD